MTELSGKAHGWPCLDWLVSNQAESNMQRAVHDRAIIRVADRTDLSGRATADKVNLDRLHNRIRKVCALVATTLILPAAG